MSLINLNSSNSKSMLINSGLFRIGVYITSPNQFLTYTDTNGMTTAYFYNGSLPYTTTGNSPSEDSSLWQALFISDKYSYLKSDIVPITSGGTGASSAPTARSNLGLGTLNNPTFAGLELNSATPYIDFHFANSTADYTTRIIESISGTLSLIGGLTMSANLYVKGSVTLDNALTISNGGTGATTNTTARTNLDVYSKAETLAINAKLTLPNLNVGTANYYKLGNLRTSGASPGYLVFEVYGANGIGQRVTNIDYVTLSAKGIDSLTTATVGSYITHTRYYENSNSPVQIGYVKLADNTVDVYICSPSGYWNGTAVYVKASSGAGTSSGSFITGDIATQIITSTWSTTIPDGYASITPYNLYTSRNTIPISNGGTGATTDVAARTNLGLGTTNSPTFQGLTISNTGTNAIITLNNGIVRANANDALVLSNTTGIYLRPAGDSVSTQQILYSQTGDLVMTGSTLTLSGTSGTLTVGGTSTLTGAVTMGSTLNATGAVTMGSTLNVTGAVVFSSTLGVTSNFSAQYIKSTGISSLSPASQGSYINWNQTTGSGKTDFINHRGGGTGGFNFWNGTNTQSLICQITSTGNVILNNNIPFMGYTSASVSSSLAKVDSTNNSVFGSTTLPTVIESSINPTVKIGTTSYDIYTSNNKPPLSAFRASYLTTAGSDLKQTITASNTAQTLTVNTITQAASFITANTTDGTFLSNTTQGMMLAISAQVIRETTGGGDVYWTMFIETSSNGTTWTSVPGSARITTLSSNITNEIKQIDFTVAIQATAGTYIRIRHATTDSTKSISVISKDALFSGAPISSGVTVSFLTL